jgi:C-terminal processing protease CtpA/Prc
MKIRRFVVMAAAVAIVFGSIYGVARHAPALFGSPEAAETAGEQNATTGPPNGVDGDDSGATMLKVTPKDLDECQHRVKAPGEFNSAHEFTCAYIDMVLYSLPLANPDKLNKFIQDWNPGKFANSEDLKMDGVPEEERMSRTYALIRRMRDALGNPEPFDYVQEPTMSASMQRQTVRPVLEGGIGAQLALENMWQIQQSVFGNIPKDGIPAEEARKKLHDASVISPDHRLLIDAPVMNGPAWGLLRSGDVVDAVDGVKLDGVNLEDAVTKIRGKPGTTVTLHILRKNAQGVEVPIDLKLLRSQVAQSAVTIHDVDGIRRVTISNFENEHLLSDFHQALTEIKEKGLKGAIIDFRGNPGGRLDFVKAMLEMVVPRGEVLMSRARTLGSTEVVQEEIIMDGPAVITETKQVGQSDDTKQFQSLKRVPFSQQYADRSRVNPGFVDEHPLQTVVDDDLPIIVLVDGNSYSASEIFAGGFQATHRGLLFGKPTAGKNDIMLQMPLVECATSTKGSQCQNGALMIIHGLFFPGGMDTDLTGVIPDKLVNQSEDYGKTDAQMEAAVASLKDQLAQQAARKAASDESRKTNSERFKERIRERNENDAKPVQEQNPHLQQ